MYKQCLNCQTNNLDTNQFCEECGQPLPQKKATATKNRPRTMLVAPPVPKKSVLTVTFKLLDGKVFELVGDGVYGIGRKDPVSNWYPELDLTTHGGELGGVSRRHAKIIIENNAAHLADVGSGNGTKHNGTKISPQQHIPLKNGDEIEFARVFAKVTITD